MEDVLILKKTNKRRDEGETDRTLSREQQDLHLQQQINKLVKKKAPSGSGDKYGAITFFF